MTICAMLTPTATPVARIEIFGQRVEREKNNRGQKIQKQLAQRGLHDIPLPVGENLGAIRAQAKAASTGVFEKRAFCMIPKSGNRFSE